jgi:acyl-coenzyme A thioesterase 13
VEDVASPIPGQSAFIALIGCRTEQFDEGVVRISLALTEDHTNPNGVMHGGVITSLMDEAVGGVIASVRGFDLTREAPHSTVEMNVSFISGARPGDELVVEARALKVGRSAAFGEAEARRKSDNAIIAKGRFTFVIQAGRAL